MVMNIYQARSHNFVTHIFHLVIIRYFDIFLFTYGFNPFTVHKDNSVFDLLKRRDQAFGFYGKFHKEEYWFTPLNYNNS